MVVPYLYHVHHGCFSSLVQAQTCIGARRTIIISFPVNFLWARAEKITPYALVQYSRTINIGYKIFKHLYFRPDHTKAYVILINGVVVCTSANDFTLPFCTNRPCELKVTV